MREITDTEIQNRLRLDNPWWNDPKKGESGYAHRRAYFETFCERLTMFDVRRAVVLMGPRRVGKTVMIRQVIEQLIQDNYDSRTILYASLDQPVYSGIWLEKLLDLFREIHGHSRDDRLFVFFDEIQYLKDWEIHLKVVVDSYPNIRFVASGSAAAALKLKSRESGAGRFSDFLLPPLTFWEFCNFQGLTEESLEQGDMIRLNPLNEAFIDYVNFGGFPEVVIRTDGSQNFASLVGEDVVDRVLLRDLPSLYGISNPQELNRLFVTLAYNTAEEVNLESLSQHSHVAKNTIKRYLEYLEAAFLIRRLHRVDQHVKHFQRAVTFKVYLTNSSLRTALFGPVGEDDPAFGRLAETAYFGQLAQSYAFGQYFYARWKKRSAEVDFVRLDPSFREPVVVAEIKWSDHHFERPEELAGLNGFLEANPKLQKQDRSVYAFTKTAVGFHKIANVDVLFFPLSLACYLQSKIEVVDFLKRGVHPLSDLTKWASRLRSSN
ncbi:MAG: ATP-binding protein [Sphingomonadales bacterium]|nr:ATP-binding protein [Sphingomonadales bacterium]